MSFSPLQFGLGMLSGSLAAGASAFFTSKYASRFVGITAPVLPKLGAGVLCRRIAYFIANDSPFLQGAATGASLAGLGFTFFAGTEIGSGLARAQPALNLHYNDQAPAYSATYRSTMCKLTIPALLAGKCFKAMTDVVPFGGEIGTFLAGAALSAYATEVAILATQFLPHQRGNS